jgi:hypothetical protein
MAEEKRSLFRFTARRAYNGGWIVGEGDGPQSILSPEYSFSNDHDFLAALPGLIGYEPEKYGHVVPYKHLLAADSDGG